MRSRRAAALLALALIPCGLQAQRYAIRDARIVTVSGPVIERGTVLIEDGRIADVGERVSVPRGTRSIRAGGLTVYPGLFNADTNLGLTEVGRVAETNDFRELGEYMPHLLAFTAVHVESEHIPVARVDGITHVLTRPSGGTIPGQGAIISLEGWTQEEMEISRHGALILDYPSLLRPRRGGFGAPGGRRTPYSEIKENYEAKVRELKELFDRARHYARAREQAAEGEVEIDIQLEALVPVVKGEQVVLIEASSHVDIRNAVEFARDQELNYVLLGGGDAWRVVDFLKENDVRVILGPRQALPAREDDPIDIVYRTPAILHEAGVPFALATGGSANVRTLAFEMGNAVAQGLPWEAALEAITLRPAQFLGVADQVGSIEKGKKANLVVADGDILEYQTRIRHLFINGQEVSLESKHTRLYQKYLNRP